MTRLWWVLGAVLVIVAGLRLRARLRRHGSHAGPRVDDEALRSILDEGRLPAGDEPLDLEEIEEEERRFWEEERWDEADEW